MSLEFYLEVLATVFIAKQAPVKWTFHPYCSAHQGASVAVDLGRGFT